MTNTALTVQELARRLIARAATPSAGPDVAALAAQAACEQAYGTLVHSLGQTGARELFTRALVHAQSEYVLLQGTRISDQAGPLLDGVSESIRAHGTLAVAAALEAVLEAVLALLVRLLGIELVTRLLAVSRSIEPPSETPQRAVSITDKDSVP